MIHKVKITQKKNKYTKLTSLVRDNFRVINGILLHEAVIVKPKHIVLEIFSYLMAETKD
jgi:hypothetical protein